MPHYNGKDYILQVKAGSDLNNLQVVKVNQEGAPLTIDSPYFTGRICIRILGFDGVTPANEAPISNSAYFNGTQRLFSIQIQGRFKNPTTADDLMWGIDFDQKLSVPRMADIALKFVQHTIDPSLECDLHAEKPWSRSPLIATMNTVSIMKLSGNTAVKAESPAPLPPWPSPNGEHVEENTAAGIPQNHHMETGERRKFLKDAAHRQSVAVTPDQVYDFDFFNPFLDFENFQIKFPAVHFSMNIMKYYNGEPLRYACKSRDHKTTFFVTQFELVDASQRVKPAVTPAGATAAAPKPL